MPAFTADLIVRLRRWLTWRFPVLDVGQVQDAVQEGLAAALKQSVPARDLRLLRMIVWRVARRLWRRTRDWEPSLEEERSVCGGQVEYLALARDLPRVRVEVARQLGRRQVDRLIAALEEQAACGCSDSEMARRCGLDRSLICRARRGVAAALDGCG